MPAHAEIDVRMKTYYEQIPKTRLMRRTPVIIRIDGKAFHSFTHGFQKPFDDILVKAMQETMKYLCKNIQGCVLGYHQSDEISLVLVDYKKLTSQAWFDYEVQKMCSISASMATMAFNKAFNELAGEFLFDNEERESVADYWNALSKSMDMGAMFDSRCFNIPKEEVTNYIYSRQIDAARNSVQMVGQHYFSHGQLQHKSCSKIQDMLFMEHGVNWNDFPTHLKRGSCCVKVEIPLQDDKKQTGWIIDTEIPMFKGVDREYIEKLIKPEE